MKKLIFVLLSAFALFSCEDPVEIEIENGVKQLSVDAFINNLPDKQVIILKYSKDFFGEEAQEAFLGASVKVSDSEGKVYSFVDVNNNGQYVWNDSILVHEGKTYHLEIKYNGDSYTCTTVANPVPSIDSLVFMKPQGTMAVGAVPGAIYAMFYANDLPGRKDYFRIKTYRNGVFDNRKNGLVGCIDGAFGNGNDGLPFIFPVRAGINDRKKPFLAGEVVKVEILSIDEFTYSFFSRVNDQINNGGLFAVPPSNVRTNIKSSSSEVSKQAIGMFSVSMVSSLEKVAGL